MTSRLLSVGAALLCLASCGTPGAPRPPSLRLPETVRDLVASRQGSTVTLKWTEPQRTTDGETIRALGPTLVCMGVNDFPMTHCDQMVADLTLKEYAQCTPKGGQPVQCAVALPLELQRENPRGQATYAIEVLNTNGRSAGLSNQVRVPTAPTAAPPNDLTANVKPNEIDIQATGVQPEMPPGTSLFYHLFRREPNGVLIDLGTKAVMAGCGPGPIELGRGPCAYTRLFADGTFEWEKTYLYYVAAVTTASLPDGSIVDIAGEPSSEITVTTHDIFPPASPQGVQAVASGVGQQPFIDLTWAPNTESDLAGYNLYRHEPGQPAAKINNELVKGPSYRDANVQRGKTYFYAVSAVDLRNNESTRSSEASEAVH